MLWLLPWWCSRFVTSLRFVVSQNLPGARQELPALLEQALAGICQAGGSR